MTTMVTLYVLYLLRARDELRLEINGESGFK